MWCNKFEVDFGNVFFERSVHPVPPATEMKKVGDLSELAHGVSGTVYIKDESTLVIKHFTYDGQVRKGLTINDYPILNNNIHALGSCGLLLYWEDW